MVKPTVRSGFLLLAVLTLAACGQKLDLRVTARLDGQPVSQAKVTIDGQEQGGTDGTGVFAKTIQRKPGAEVEVLVVKELPGYRIKPWKTSFLVKLPKGGAVDTYAFDADLEATRYITLVATEKGTPVADATVKVNDKELGKTGATGEFVYEYKNQPKTGVTLTV
ncbi:MAG TPA: hypothetical protein VGV13_12700, partial [Methylomirabilota bacterium]|nr:hypothetical protein [Methylomirabilota bacterium]